MATNWKTLEYAVPEGYYNDWREAHGVSDLLAPYVKFYDVVGLGKLCPFVVVAMQPALPTNELGYSFVVIYRHLHSRRWRKVEVHGHH